MTNELENSFRHLERGNIILYPTDTVWGIGCDATNPVAVQKIYSLKQREDSKALICLVDSVEMLSSYVATIPEQAFPYLEALSRPTTIIYPKAQHLAKNLIAQDGSIAIRICQTEFCKHLLSKFGKPIVSTSANISKRPTPQTFGDIENEIKGGVDYIVNVHQDDEPQTPSKIIRFDGNGNLKIIRD